MGSPGAGFCPEENLPKEKAMTGEPPEIIEPSDDIHTWFGLSYANFLVLPRAHLQSMPAEWQHLFVGLLDILSRSYPNFKEPTYFVSEKDEHNKFVKSTVPHYNRGRAFVPPELAIEQIKALITELLASVAEPQQADLAAASEELLPAPEEPRRRRWLPWGTDQS
jgi:hypothetical protein